MAGFIKYIDYWNREQRCEIERKTLFLSTPKELKMFKKVNWKKIHGSKILLRTTVV